MKSELFTEGFQRGSRVGRFSICDVLGVGSMGVVYRAVDSDNGRAVALKTVSVRQHDCLSSIRREIHTLAQLDHPGIVKMVAEGVSDGVPWYAMELLEGATLRDHIATLQGEHADPLRTGAATFSPHASIALAIRICAILTFLHDRGVVHGDLKPENIFLIHDGQPVLVDFGLAWNVPGGIAREVLGDLGGATGTPIYMSPEQIFGEPIDTRADLYSFGCILFEMLTGKPPFDGRRAFRTIADYLSEQPIAPSRLNPRCPVAIDRVVLSLLAKKRHERAGNAGDVLVELMTVSGLESSIRANHEQPILFRPPLLGRDALLQDLVRLTRRARQGDGAFILLRGESGIGKTYVANELVRCVGDHIVTMTATCKRAWDDSAEVRSEPLHPFRALLRAVADRCVEEGATAYHRLLGRSGQTLALYEQSLAGLPGSADYPAPPVLSGPGAREHVFACLAAVLEAFANEAPLLFIIDDIQWADELSISFLNTRPDEWYQSIPALVLGTVRDDGDSSVLEKLRVRNDVLTFILGGLGEDEVRSLILEMVGLDHPPITLGRFLAKRCRGNPFFVAEYLRVALGEGSLRRVSGALCLKSGEDPSEASLGDLPFPHTVHDLVLRRIGRLGPSARIVLDVCSVVGREFEEQDVEAAIGSSLSEPQRMEAISELLTGQFLEQCAASRFRFVHDRITEIAYRAIVPTSRQALHRAVATAFETRSVSAGVSPAEFGTLAHHWEAAGECDLAIDYLDKAGSHAVAAAAYTDAVGFLRRALSLSEARSGSGLGTPHRFDRVKWECGLAKAEHGLGNPTAAERHALSALRILGYRFPFSGRQWAIFLAREIVKQCGHLAGTIKWMRGDGQGDRRWAAQAAVVLAYQYFYSDNALGVFGASLVAINLAEEAGSESEVPRGYVTVATLLGLLRASRLAERFFRIGHHGALESNDVAEYVYCRATEAVYCSTFGDWHRARRAAHDAERSVTHVNDSFLREMVWTAIAHLNYFTGDLHGSLQRFEEVLRSARLQGNQQHTAWALFSIARSLEALGRFEEALPLLEEARSMLAVRPELQSEIICAGLLAIVRLRLDDREGARRAADETFALIRRAIPVGFPALVGYRSAIEVYLELGTEAKWIRRALRSFGIFAALIPLARPAHWLCVGLIARREGRERAARRAFARSLRHATRLGMPVEQGRAHMALSELSQRNGDIRGHHREAAATIFKAAGCEHYLRACMAP